MRVFLEGGIQRERERELRRERERENADIPLVYPLEIPMRVSERA